MNFAYLARKYLGVECLVEDRTYEGLMWPKTAPIEKPSQEVFSHLQQEEERTARSAEALAAIQDSVMKEKQEQARAQALEDAKPFEAKINEEQAKIRNQVREMRLEAIMAQEALRTRDEVGDFWQEITRAQDIINQEAQTYLADTDWYVSRQNEDGKAIPQDVLEKRQLARQRIENGKTVYARWQELRGKEMPSQKEIQEAIRAGGEELKRIQAVCKSVALRYPKPRRQHS